MASEKPAVAGKRMNLIYKFSLRGTKSIPLKDLDQISRRISVALFLVAAGFLVPILGLVGYLAAVYAIRYTFHQKYQGDAQVERLRRRALYVAIVGLVGFAVNILLLYIVKV